MAGQGTDRSAYTWPLIMFCGSLINIGGAAGAIYSGADRTQSGGVNPFFYTAIATSFAYLIGHTTKLTQIYIERSHQERELERRRATLAPLESINIER